MDVGWAVTIAVVALVVGASAGALLTAVLIAVGRAQRDGGDATCPSCPPSRDLALGRPPRTSAPDAGGGAPADV